MTLFDRHELERALGLLATELKTRGISTTIQIIGGAAIALRYYDRVSTTDIDGAIRLTDLDEFRDAASAVARREGWPSDWINNDGAKYIPTWGAAMGWVTIHDDEGVVIQVASADALLAMKLLANRPGRDGEDIAHLMVICGKRTLAELEELFDKHYPGDALSDRAIRMITKITEAGLPQRVAAPPAPQIEKEGTERRRSDRLTG